MSGIAVADNDGKIKDNGTINIGKGDVEGSELHANSVGFAKLKERVEDAIKDGGGTTGGGTTGGGGGGGGNAAVNSFNYRVDGPASNQTILTGNGFLLRASSAGGGPCSVFIDSTQNNMSFDQYGVSTDPGANNNDNEAQDDDFDVADPDQNLLPDDQTDILMTLNVRPLNGAVTTVNYAVDQGEQGFDCSITGTAVTQG
jgi:hypothetical protein